MVRTSKTTHSLQNLIEFSVKSLSQAYGHTFIRHVALRHPLRLLRGLWAYYRVLRADHKEERLLFRDNEEAFVRRAAGDGKRLLVGTGFCQKPLPRQSTVQPPRTAMLGNLQSTSPRHNGSKCPAGRFSHNCLYLSRLRANSRKGRQLHPACTDCFIHTLGQAAFEAGASFVVLTSALDIAHDILLPALEEQRFTRILFAICPYSVEPMSLALLICDIEGYIFHYDVGACANYSQWLRADRGDKPERTVLSAHNKVRLLGLLEAIATQRHLLNKAQPMCYQRVGNIFVPCYN